MQKTALITGASKRIGQAIARHLAAQGWNVAIHYNSSATEAQKLQKELKQQFPQSEFDIFQANLMDMADVQRLIPAVVRRFESLDLLVNNASVFEPSSLKETSLELLQRQMIVNFQAPFLLCRDLANACKKGLIINLVDTRITNNRSNFAAYSMSKKALWELTKMAALEFAPNIRVNAIAPGVSLPPEDKDEKYLWKLAQDIPMQKPGGLEPILRSLDFILANDHLTGQLLFADGGENLGKNN
ncbi:SDR family NAD(P)-dependent oxidoreductase [Sunxiuqinia dokdonensis]|uniref:Dihydrofolate reductase n=1 Tax=Sunxiuqinia dokdonensis TaxID=1409788 RepID=A0A0L8V7F7_9BACT|nr:SDR family NAD(P)-dependent oxidoreductase [Sunxiuqinia dokdonensis]KOH44379.1 dihydrofolate reductase [Sunxiuqinia dokdonensis]